MKQQTHHFTQINHAPPHIVFPLLCPVRESEWLDDWVCSMIHSRSGIAEKGCIFQTNFNNHKQTWIITEHNKSEGRIEFWRTDNQSIAIEIKIQLQPINISQTKADISYTYTAMDESGIDMVDNFTIDAYELQMIHWQKSINHFLDQQT